MSKCCCKQPICDTDTEIVLLYNLFGGAWEFLEVKPYPLTTIELDKDYFEDKNVHLFDKYVGPACSGSGYSSECYFGKIENEEIYFYTMDDPGLSGYDCCGSLTLYYAESIEIVKENMDFLEKVENDLH